MDYCVSVCVSGFKKVIICHPISHMNNIKVECITGATSLTYPSSALKFFFILLLLFLDFYLFFLLHQIFLFQIHSGMMNLLKIDYHWN